MSSPKSNILKFNAILARLPLMNLGGVSQPYGITLNNLKIILQINDERYKIERLLNINKEINITSAPYNAIERYFLDVIQPISNVEIKKQ